MRKIREKTRPRRAVISGLVGIFVEGSENRLAQLSLTLLLIAFIPICFLIISPPLLLKASQAQEPYPSGLVGIFVEGSENRLAQLSLTFSLLPDLDYDEIEDSRDNCIQAYNPDQKDFDGDGVGDACDNCLLVPNPDQLDTNQDGIGNACEKCPDADGDLVCDWEDNCPKVYNPNQLDWDGDGVGDACDSPPALLCPDTIIVEAGQPEGAAASQLVQGSRESLVRDLRLAGAPGAGEIARFLSSPQIFGLSGTILTNDAPPVFRFGSTMVTFTATDPQGGSASCQAKVVVQDTTPPIIRLPDDLTAGQEQVDGTPATNARIAAFLAGALATDLADPTVSISVQPILQVFPLGETPVTFTATDRSGNTASGQATVRVVPALLTLTITRDTTLSAEDRTHDHNNLIVDGCGLIIQGEHELNRIIIQHGGFLEIRNGLQVEAAVEVAEEIALQGSSSLSIQKGGTVRTSLITVEGQSTISVQNGGLAEAKTLSVSQDSVITPQSFKNITLPPLSPDFTMQPASGDAPMKVQFTDQSSGCIQSWLWDFGDGESSACQNPAHTYARVGRFTVTLTVNGPAGGSEGGSAGRPEGPKCKVLRGAVSTVPLSASIIWSGEITIASDTVIPEGESLLIQPGSVVRCLGDFGLTVRGTLYAVGRPDSPILFTSSQGYWKGLTISSPASNSTASSSPASSESSIQYCRFEKVLEKERAALAEQAALAERAALTVQNASPFVACNLFCQNSIGLLLQNSGGEYLRNTLAENSLAAICLVNSAPPGPLSLRQNLIAKNGTGILVVQTDQNVSITDNNFQTQAIYHLKNISSIDVPASSNWWDAAPSPASAPDMAAERAALATAQADADPAARIAGLIYDRQDNAQCGQVVYEPFLQAPHPAAPVPYVSGLRFLAAETGATLSWAPLAAEDIQGYRVYVQNSGVQGTETQDTSAEADSSFRMLRQVEGKTSVYLEGFSPDYGYAVTACDREGNESRYTIPPPTPTGFSVLSTDQGGIQIIFDPAQESNLLGYWLSYGTQRDRVGSGLNPETCQKLLISARSASSLSLANDITWYLSLTAIDLAGNQSIPTAALSFTHTQEGILTFQKSLDNMDNVDSVDSGTKPDHYRMISLPLQTMTHQINQLLKPLGKYDPRSWRLLRYDPDQKRYLEFPEVSTLAPGESVWIISREEKRITFYGYATPTDESYRVPLKPGWNQIANPFHFPVSWEDVYRLNANTVQNKLYQYNGQGTTPYIRASQLDPGEGYWVKNILTHEEDLLIPPVSQNLPAARLKSSAAAATSSASPASWIASADFPPLPPQAISRPDSLDSAPKSCFLAACAVHGQGARSLHLQGQPKSAGLSSASWLGLLLCLCSLCILCILALLPLTLDTSPGLVGIWAQLSLTFLISHPSPPLILFLCLLFLCPLPLEAAQAKDPSLLQQGIRKYRDQQYEEATAMLKEAVKAAPAEAKAHLYLGLTYYQKGMLDEAQEELQKVISLSQGSRITVIARNYQNIISQKKKKLLLSLFASIQYDDNVLLAPFSAETKPSDRADWKNIFILNSRIRPWRGKHTLFLIGYDFYQSLYHELHDNNIRGHIGSLILQHQSTSYRVEVKSAYNHFLLDDRRYLEGKEVSLFLSHDQTRIRQGELTLDYQWKTFPYLKGRDATRAQLGIGEIFFSKDHKKQFRLGYTCNREEVDTDYLSFQEHEFSTDYRTPFLYKTQLNLMYAYTIRDFLHPDPAYGGQERDDDKRTISATLLKKLRQGFGLTLQYSRILNYSNYSNLNQEGMDRRYRRNLYTAGILKQF